ncbi:glycosyltransferase family A protein [Micromonospora sp. NPDC000207]|uniref:glycosyltransferase family 2 protein n=1 Tax=Micromonospora sp. NPDC000207 TaxID=3154246 RepID=UPI003325E64F
MTGAAPPGAVPPVGVGDGAARVAVVVPNFNKAKTLRACLESVLGQSLAPVEVVVVDDASTDGSREIVAEFPVRLVVQSVNRGPAAARNVGVASCSAPLVFFVDSDTALASDAIEEAVGILRGGVGVGMVQGIYAPEPLFDDGPVEAYRVAFEHFWRRRTVGRETGALFAATLVPREVFTATGGFDERLRDGEDDEFGTRLPGRYRLVATDRVTTRHDDVDRLAPLLREQYVRARTKPALMVRTRRRQRGGAVTGERADLMSTGRYRRLDRDAQLSLVTSALALVVLPVAAFAPVAALAWPVLVAGFVAANAEFLRLAYRLRGAGFALTAAGLHLLSHTALVAGLGAGLPRAAVALLRDVAVVNRRSSAADAAQTTEKRVHAQVDRS